MEIIKYIYGGAAYRRKVQISATVSNVGVPLLAATGSNDAGVILATATNAANMVGINYDTATYVTAQQSDGTSAERLVTVDIRPDCVIEALITGGASENTALTLHDVTTATSDGLDVTTGEDLSAFLEGTAFAYDGVNQGQQRKVDAVDSATDATIQVAFDGDHAVGDNFIFLPWWPFNDAGMTVTLSTALTQVRADSTISTSAAEFLAIFNNLKDTGAEGTTKSTVHLVPDDHYMNKLS